MKILTTQNLNSLASAEKTTNNYSSIPNEIRYNFLLNNGSLNPSDNNDAVAFKAKKPSGKDIKKVLKVVEEAKKKVGEIAKEASPEVKRGDKLFKSPFFRKICGVSDYETVVQSTIAAVACALRALTIVGMSNEENKGNNAYAAGHALASGIVGFITVFALTTPFKAGSDHVMRNLKDLSDKTLKRLYPHLDLKSTVNAEGKRIPHKIVEEINGEKVEKILWKNLDGLEFCADMKTCDMLPKFRPLSEMSQESFESILGVQNVNWAKFKDKSFNAVVNEKQKGIHELIDFNKLGLVFEHVETPVGKKVGFFKRLFNKNAEVEPVKYDVQVLFKDMDKEFFTDFVSKLDDSSPWKQLDIESAFENGSMKHFDKWKKLDGNPFKLDLDSVYAYSPLETYDRALRSNGTLRFDEVEGIHKIRGFQRNGVNGNRGTEISDEMLNADKDSAALIRGLTWIPDLLFRIPIAMTTVAMIPWILKTVFGIEKQKPQPKEAEVKPQEVTLNKPEIKPEAVAFKGNNSTVTPDTAESNENISFKAGAPKKPGFFKKLTEKIGEFMGKLYGKKLIESDRMAKVSAALSDIPGGVTQAMATFGALLTSSTYVTRTLGNKDLEDDKKRTLAVNQTLCFIVPTIAAYTVDKLISGWVKKQEYRFKNVNLGVAEKLKADGKTEAAEKLVKQIVKNSNGVRILASLATFTMIYRYATPVLITPLANKIGNWANARRAEKQAAEKEAQTAKVA